MEKTLGLPPSRMALLSLCILPKSLTQPHPKSNRFTWAAAAPECMDLVMLVIYLHRARLPTILLKTLGGQGGVKQQDGMDSGILP